MTGGTGFAIRPLWLLLFACLAGGFTALSHGFALEWDLLNYHLYNPHALLNDRLAGDIAPAQQQTYLNPAMFLPLYVVFEQLGTQAYVFFIGAIQGAQLVLLLLLLNELTGRRLTGRWELLLMSLLGLAGPIFLNQLGGSQGDTILSALVLAGLLVVILELDRTDQARTMEAGFLGGLLLGMACAFKLTMALYAVSLALAAFIFFSGSRRWRITAGLAMGGVTGVLLAGGAWFFHLWQEYGNPLFPFFNNLFASPWIDEGSYRDTRFLPAQIAEWLFYPFYWWQDPTRVWEYEFQDIRVPVVIAAVFILPFTSWRQMRKKTPALGLAWLFVAFSYLLWLKLFSIYRYLSVVEMLAPLVLFASLALYLRSRLLLLAGLLLLLGTQALVFYPQGNTTWELQADTATVFADLPEGSMVLIDGYYPIAYTGIWLEPDVPLVRIRANFMRTTEPQNRMQELAHVAVKSHTGPKFLLLPLHESRESFIAADLAQVGLELPDVTLCEPVFESQELQNLQKLVLCPLHGTGSAYPVGL